MKVVTVLFGLLFVSYAAQADITGSYSAGNRGHYDTVRISPRGYMDYLVKTCGYFGDVGCMPIEAVVTGSGDTYESIRGIITIYYGNSPCFYPYEMKLRFSGTDLYLSSYGPTFLPLRSNGCPDRSRLRYGPYIESNVYKKL